MCFLAPAPCSSHYAAAQVENHLSEKKKIRCASTEPPEFCTDFLLHFKAALLLLWLVTVVLLQETNHVAGQRQRALLEKRGHFIISDLLLSPHLIQRYLRSPGSRTWSQTHTVICFWMTKYSQLC